MVAQADGERRGVLTMIPDLSSNLPGPNRAYVVGRRSFGLLGSLNQAVRLIMTCRLVGGGG